MICRGCIKHNKITVANDDLIVLGSYAYDKFGNSVETIDVLCNTIFHTYDSFDNILSEWGTIYLVRYAYNARNAADGVVNGRYDLVNLFAARLDLKPFIEAWGTAVRFELSAYSEDTMRYCTVNVNPNEVGKIYTDDTFTKNADTPLHSAPLTALHYDGISIDPSKLLGEGNAPGVLAFEAAAAHENVTLKVKLGDETILSFPMPISISSVREMYRWLNIRSACGGTGGDPSRLDEPNNLPDSECDGQHFVFVHGYNVNPADARKWGDQMFKRLWLSGMKSMFTAVNWFGNKSQIWEGVPLIGGKSLDYYSNVRNALDSAPYLAEAVNALTGKKIMLAHSLGNMLVSESAKYHNLIYNKYYMLNAAVPIEAYNENSYATEMTEHGWYDIDQSKWAANWHTCITIDNDSRKSLKWRGRYSGMHDIVNCYSPTEEILANATVNGWGGVWGAQELFKGTASLHFVPGNCEGGWGYNDEYTNIAGILTDFAKTNEFTNLELIVNPLFRKLDNGIFHQTNSIAIAQTELNKVMGDAIPATSFAAGANPIGASISEDYNYQSSERPNGWPRDTYEWYHSDVCNIAYLYIYNVFYNLIK